MTGLRLGPTVLGFLLIAAAAVLLLMDTDHLSQRMPIAVPPRGFALLPLAAGIVLIVVGVAY